MDLSDEKPSNRLIDRLWLKALKNIDLPDLYNEDFAPGWFNGLSESDPKGIQYPDYNSILTNPGGYQNLPMDERRMREDGFSSEDILYIRALEAFRRGEHKNNPLRRK